MRGIIGEEVHTCREFLLQVGDLVQLRSDARFGGSRSPTTGNNVYVGFVRKLWETKMKSKRVKVAWCYRSNEVEQQISSHKKLQWPDVSVSLISATWPFIGKF